MQTQEMIPVMPPPPQVRPERKMNWTYTIVAGGLGLLVAVVSIVMLQTRSAELARTRESLSSIQATVATQASDLDSARSNLRSTKATLASARSDLRDTKSALNLTYRCAASTLNAWYSTTNDSYTVTGFALQRAVKSFACRTVHTAHMSASGSTA